MKDRNRQIFNYFSKFTNSFANKTNIQNICEHLKKLTRNFTKMLQKCEQTDKVCKNLIKCRNQRK